MSDILYPDLKMVNYRKLHHRSKFKILSDILKNRFQHPEHIHKIVTKIFYYSLESDHQKDLFIIQSRDHLEKGYIFPVDLKGLGKSLAYTKLNYLSQKQNKKNKVRYKLDSKAVYFLIDKDRLFKLKKILKTEKKTVKDFFTSIIDQKINS